MKATGWNACRSSNKAGLYTTSVIGASTSSDALDADNIKIFC